MKKLRYILFFALVSISLSLSAQDIHFTQFYMNPLHLNPAMTGLNNCKSRVIVNYRNQWAGALGGNAYNTFSASFDQKNTIGRSDYFGIGGAIWRDVAGASRYGTTQAKVALSYSKKLSGYRKRASYLVLGADGGLAQRSISKDDLRWPNQFDSDGYHEGWNSGELRFTDTRDIYLDLALGGVFFNILDDDMNWYVGAAIHHFNSPKISFLGDDVRLYTRWTGHGGGQFPLTRRISLMPFFVYFNQGPHNQLNLGASTRFKMGRYRDSGQSWQLGGYYRIGNKVEGGLHSDAVILSSRFNYNEFSFGFSYDFNISGLSAVGNANGAFEFSLKYEICGPEVRGVYCPNF